MTEVIGALLFVAALVGLLSMARRLGRDMDSADRDRADWLDR